MKLCRWSSVAPCSSPGESSAARPTVSACAAGLTPHRRSSSSSRQAGAAAVAAVAAVAAAAEEAAAAAPSATSVRFRFAGVPPPSTTEDGPGARRAS